VWEKFSGEASGNSTAQPEEHH
jgi:hypothetical protein